MGQILHQSRRLPLSELIVGLKHASPLDDRRFDQKPAITSRAEQLPFILKATPSLHASRQSHNPTANGTAAAHWAIVQT